MLISIFAAMGMAMNAEIIDYTDGDFWYCLETETKTAELAWYSGSATEVTIPASVVVFSRAYSVTSIRYGCFSSRSFLTSITIPSSVISLGEQCFYECKALTSIIVDEDNPVYDSRENCNAIIETESNTMIAGCASTSIPSSVTSLGEHCFSGCTSLVSIDIPSSVTSLGNDCFSDCWALTSIDIPSSVTSIGYNCFRGCSALTSINIPSSVTSLEDCCFSGCESLTSIDIPSSVTSLGKSCFSGCSSLTSIDIPSSVTSLGYNCFCWCYALTSIVIPSSVTSLGEGCFCWCSALTSIVIPSSVTSIGDACFSWCSSLTSIIVDENNPVYDSRENCNAIINTQSNTMITGCASTVIPSSVTSLGVKCFYGCRSLTSIDIPSSVTSLGDGCFYGCSALTSIDIPSSVTSIGGYCFYSCSALTSIDIPSSVTSLGDMCFDLCFSLQTMTCEIPTAIKGEFFSGTPIEQATLYVPESSLLSYQSTSPWSSFGTILPISSDGIGEIATDGEAGIDAIYDIGGKRINGSARGLNIIRMSDGTTRKVLK